MENNKDILEEKSEPQAGDVDPAQETEISSFSADELTEEVEEGIEGEDPESVNSEVAKLKAQLEEQKDKYMRLFAEFDNFKRRNARERIDLMQTAGKEVITSLLDVLDDTDRAEKQMQETDDAEQIKKGVSLVFNKLRKTLKAKGLEAMESIGKEFDVEKHEAITEIPVEDKKLKGKIADDIQKGYYLNDKLIRFAKVILGKQ
jgi:molecular chaperone GrpE